MSAPELGLRERKKQMTRDSIADAALRLALEKGLADVTIEEIARVAFVSPRTFSNYFSCKEEAVAAAGTQDTLTLIENFTERPLSETPLQSLGELLVDFARSRPPDRLDVSVQKLKLEQDNPTILPFQKAQYEQLEAALRAVVAERTGTTLDTDMYPWLVAAAAVSALTSATRLWAASGSPAGQLPELIRSAFNQIANGLPSPDAG